MMTMVMLMLMTICWIWSCRWSPSLSSLLSSSSWFAKWQLCARNDDSVPTGADERGGETVKVWTGGRFCQTFYILDLLLPKILDSPTCALLYSRSTVTLILLQLNQSLDRRSVLPNVLLSTPTGALNVRMHHRQRQRRQLVAFTLWIVTLVPIPNLKAAKHHIFQLFYISIFLKYWNLPGKKS